MISKTNIGYLLVTAVLLTAGFIAYTVQSKAPSFGAQPALTVFQGGTGSTSPSGILIGDNGATPRLSTLTIGTNLTLVGTTLNATGGSGTPGGTSGQVQYNANGTFGGVSTTTLVAGTNVTFSGGPVSVIGTSPLTINATGGGTGASTTLLSDNNTFSGTNTFTKSPVLNTLGAGTVNSTSGGTLYNTATSSVTNGTGISFSGTPGALVGGTALTITNSGVTSNVAGTGISVSGATGAVTITNTGVTSLGNGTGTTCSGTAPGTCNVNTTQNITNLSNLTTAGTVNTTASGALYSTATSSLIAGTGVSFSGTPGALIGGTNLTITATGSVYPFPVAINATTTLTQFNGGLTAYSSSTIGNGTQANGLTISGGATTTGNQYVAGTVGVGTTSPWATVSINAAAQSNPYFAIGSSTSRIFSIAPSATTLFGVGGTTTPGTTISFGDATPTWGINLGSATSTWSTTGGINLTAGCFSIAGTCITGGGGGGGAAYPFQLTGNATSTLTQFNGGLTAYATSTIGDGTNAGGLTTNGSATTTGSLVVQNSSGQYSVFGTPIGGTGSFQNPGTDVLAVGTTTSSIGARAGIFTALYTGGSSGSIIQGINAFAVSNGTGNLTAVNSTGGSLRNRYLVTNGSSGFNDMQISALSSGVTVSGALSSSTDAADFHAETPTVNSGDLITDFYGLWVRGGSVAGTITNRYGVFIDDLVGGVNRYGIYQSGSSDNNYFAGNLGLGTTSPYAKFSLGGGNLVVGAATAGGTLGDLFLPKLGTPAGTFLAADATGKIIATTTPSGGSGITSITGPTGLAFSGTPASTATLGTGYSIKELPSWTVGAAGADFTTIQAAMTQCGAVGGGSIYLVDASYSQGGTGLTWGGSNCAIYGRNAGTTTISFTGATTLFKTNSAVSHYTHDEIHNVLVSGNDNASSIGIDWSDMTHGIVDGVQETGVGTGIRLNDTQNITFYNSFTNMDLNDIRTIGIDASSTNPTNANTFRNIFIGSTVANVIAFQMNNGNGNTADMIFAEPGSITGTVGLKLFDNTLSTNNGVFNNTFSNWYIEANATGVSIPTTVHPSAGGIQRNTLNNMTVEANTTDWNIPAGAIAKNTIINGYDSNFGNPLTTFGGPFGIGTSSELLGIGNTPNAQLAINASTTLASNAVLVGLTSGATNSTFLQITNTGTIFAPNTTGSSATQTGYWCYDATGQFIRDTVPCTTISGGASFPFTPGTQTGTVVSTTTAIFDTLGLQASSTSYFSALNARANGGSSLVPGTFVSDSSGVPVTLIASDATNFANSSDIAQFSQLNGSDSGAVLHLNDAGTGPALYVQTGNSGIATATPQWPLEIANATKPQLALSDGTLTSNQWTFRNTGGTLYIATTSPSTFATSTGQSAITIAQQSTTQLGVGTTSPWRTLSINGTVGFSGLTSSGSSQTDNLCLSSNNEVIADTAACLISARRFKDNISSLSSETSLDEVLQLDPVTFTYKADFNGALESNVNYNSPQVGFIADEVQKIDPRLVTVETASTTFEGISYPAGTVQSVRYENMTALLAAAIQQLNTKIDAQKITSTQDIPQDVIILVLVLWCSYLTLKNGKKTK